MASKMIPLPKNIVEAAHGSSVIIKINRKAYVRESRLFTLLADIRDNTNEWSSIRENTDADMEALFKYHRAYRWVSGHLTDEWWDEYGTSAMGEEW